MYHPLDNFTVNSFCLPHSVQITFGSTQLRLRYSSSIPSNLIWYHLSSLVQDGSASSHPIIMYPPSHPQTVPSPITQADNLPYLFVLVIPPALSLVKKINKFPPPPVKVSPLASSHFFHRPTCRAFPCTFSNHLCTSQLHWHLFFLLPFIAVLFPSHCSQLASNFILLSSLHRLLTTNRFPFKWFSRD